MPRLFLGNFDFEHRLADPIRQLPAKLERINAELASSWLAIADDGDYLWTPQPIEASFFEQSVRDGLPRVIPVVSFNDVPRGVECIPWGWTDDVRRLCDKQGWVRNDPPHEAVHAGNSRRFSAALEREWLCGLDFAGEATSLHEIERLIAFHGADSRWVVKAAFGMSGRERILGCGPPTVTDRNWIDKRLASDGVVFFEPWVERLEEVGIQLDIPRKGDYIQLNGIVPMLVDERGQYTGSWFAPRVKPTWADSLPFWNSTMDVVVRAAMRLQELGYFGPLGIDAMRYRAPNGEIRLRPLQDINARWTMGRLSLGLRRWLQPDESGCWRHGSSESGRSTTASQSETPAEVFRQFLLTQGLPMTPVRVAIVDAFFAPYAQFRVEELVEKFRQSMGAPPGSRNAVLRMLNSMEQAGLIRKMKPDDKGEAYELGHFFAKRRTVRTSPETVGDSVAHHQSRVLVY
jgi:hypothetical protein